MDSRPSSTSEKSDKFKTGDRKAATDATDFLDAKQKQKRQKDLERLGLFSDIGYLQPNVYVPKDKGMYMVCVCVGWRNVAREIYSEFFRIIF